jgi:hypothetical protein
LQTSIAKTLHQSQSRVGEFTTLQPQKSPPKMGLGAKCWLLLILVSNSAESFIPRMPKIFMTSRARIFSDDRSFVFKLSSSLTESSSEGVTIENVENEKLTEIDGSSNISSEKGEEELDELVSRVETHSDIVAGHALFERKSDNMDSSATEAEKMLVDKETLDDVVVVKAESLLTGSTPSSSQSTSSVSKVSTVPPKPSSSKSSAVNFDDLLTTVIEKSAARSSTSEFQSLHNDDDDNDNIDDNEGSEEKEHSSSSSITSNHRQLNHDDRRVQHNHNNDRDDNNNHNDNPHDPNATYYLPCGSCRAIYIADYEEMKLGRRVTCSLCNHSWWQSPGKLFVVCV